MTSLPQRIRGCSVVRNLRDAHAASEWVHYIEENCSAAKKERIDLELWKTCIPVGMPLFFFLYTTQRATFLNAHSAFQHEGSSKTSVSNLSEFKWVLTAFVITWILEQAMSSFDKVVKLACKPKAAVPKPKVAISIISSFTLFTVSLQYLDTIIAATWSDDGAIHDVCKALSPRLREPNTIACLL